MAANAEEKNRFSHVEEARKLVAKPEYRIQLDDLLTTQSHELVKKLEDDTASMQGPWSAKEFARRVEFYETSTEPLARMIGVLGRWGSDVQVDDTIDVLLLVDGSVKPESGLTAWLNLRQYPAVLLVSTLGTALTKAKRWSLLHRLLSYTMRHDNDPESQRLVERLYSESWKGSTNDTWRSLNGLDRRKTALSDHICELLREWSESFAGVVPDFEALNDTWGGSRFFGI